MRAQAAARPYAGLLTPADERLYAAMVAFSLKPEAAARVKRRCAERKIWISGGENSIRISTHIHTRPSDIEAFFAVMDEAAA